MTKKLETLDIASGEENIEGVAKVTFYQWLGNHIIFGIPTRKLTLEEYEVFKEKIELSESAVQCKIYEIVEE